jgi:hypothetical protein
MKPLRAYLFTKSDGGDWASSAFRELEPLIDAARTALSVESASAAIHVGFWRPETQTIAELAQAWPGALLLSNAAISSLPPPVSMSSQPVGEVDGLQFRLALAGFGYEIADPTQPSAAIPQPVAAPVLRPHGAFEPRGWVEQLLKDQPQFEQALRKADIWDDESYIAYENSLDTPIRRAVSLARYTLLSGESPSASGILNNLHACPPWFLNDKLEKLESTVRMNNVFNANNLVTISNIATKGYDRLLRLPNLGLKSVHGIGKLLFEAFVNGDALKRQPSTVIETVKRSKPADDEQVIKPTVVNNNEVRIPQVPKTDVVPDLISGLVEAAQLLSENERGIFAARLGYRSEPLTLQQISYQIGVSRERVRQIEVKIFRKIKHHPVWKSLADRLDLHLAERTSPFFLAGIPAVDPWFKGVEGLENSLIEIFKHLFEDRFSIIRIDDVPIITHLSNDEWIDAIYSGRTLLSEMVSEKPAEDYVRLQIEALLSDKGAELRETLWRQVSSLAIWASREGDTRRLSGYGRTVEAVVTAVLEEAGMPLHYTEIERRASQFEGRKFETRRLHQTAATVGMLYGRGTYGLLSHCPLSSGERDLIITEVEDIISNGDTTRQWHTSELMDELLDRGLDFDGRISKYIINISLQNSEQLVYLKRMVWGLKESWTESAASRLDLRQAVLSLLESEGCPMTTADIREKMFSGRGVNSNFQIHPAGNLIRIGSSKWGLADRDIQLKDPAACLDRIEQHFAETNQGIHVSEVSSVLDDIDEDTSTAFFGYCKGKGFKVDRAQYLYPAAWPNSRRVWPNVAVRMALEKRSPEGISFDDIFNTVCSLTKRNFKRMQISQILVVMEDSVFDPATEKWRIDRDLISDSEAQEEMEQGM